MTHKQSTFLDKNKHIYAVAELPDGDILCVDLEARCNRFGIVVEEFPAYVLNKNGHLQNVAHHYNHQHLLDVPCIGSYLKQHDERL